MLEYNQIVAFSEGEKLVFPDFTIQFQQKKIVPGPNQAAFNMTFYHFLIQTEESVQEIIWSSGTGRITPTRFEVNGIKFTLELAYSLTHKTHLEKKQLVICKVG